ncbi:membrane protein [Psychromonas marina]|uniref:Membrane protein n=1 Tax=Psychromonas marina TaxID=88364 RepID=A0ABQ6E563_9GAMM|nr:DUF1007 family protein [Psychromonas marina]GLS92481.1 membrane protein [Psychromonas marina]
MKPSYFRVHPTIFQPILWLLFLIILSHISEAKAHPHSWVSVLTELEGDSRQLSGLRMYWTFDLITTSDALAGEDLSADNQPLVLQALAAEMLSNIKNEGYYTHLENQGGGLHFKEPDQATLTLEDYKLTLQFFLELEQPLALPLTDLTLKIYEDTYYVDFLWLQKDDLQLSESFHADCQLKLVEAQTTSEQIAYVSSLPIDAQGDSKFGEMFTQSVTINCL